MKYFTIKELCYSDTAKKYKIDNTPNEEIIENLTEFTNEVLDKLREVWGSPIKVSSGYRCEKLNKKVGGSSTSSHIKGYAADLVPVNGDTNGLVKCAIELSKTFNFDQIIDEYSGNKHWLHIGYKNLKGQQRKEIKVFKNGKYQKI
jgi:hypothetical protein